MIPELTFFPAKYAANKMLYRTDQRILYINNGTFVAPNFVIAADPLAVTIFVGTGAQINALSPTAGDKAFCTLTGNGFDKDITYYRNTANTAWRRDGTFVDIIKRIDFVTLPADGEFGKLVNQPILEIHEASAQPQLWREIQDDTKIRVVGEDFKGYANQTEADNAWVSTDNARARVDITNDELDLNSNVLVTNLEGIDFDLGNTIGTTVNGKFILRYKMTIDTFSSDSGNSGHAVGMGLCDLAGPSNTPPKDFLGFYVMSRASTDSYTAYFRDTDNLNNHVVGQNFARTPTAETLFVEIIRTSTTQYTVELFSDSDYSVSLEKETVTISANIQNLKFIKGIVNTPSAGSGSIVARIENIEFYDEVSSL